MAIEPDKTARLFSGNSITFKDVMISRTDEGLKVKDQVHETHLSLGLPNYMNGCICLVILHGDQVYIYTGMSFGQSMLKRDEILNQHGLA